MPTSLKELQQMESTFREDRKVMNENNTFPQVLKYLKTEVDELDEAHQNGDREEVGRELADVLLYTLALAGIYGINLEEEVLEKVAFNLTRYQSKYFNNGLSYDEARKIVKEDEKTWKKEFYSIPK